MTTSPVNYGVTNAYQELVSEWTATMARREFEFEPFTRIHTDNAAQIRRWGDLPIGRMPTWNGDAAIAAQAVGATNVNSYEPTGKALKVEILNFDVIHNPGIVQKKLAQLQDAVVTTANALVFGALETANSPDTYDNGAGGTSPVIGATHKYATPGDADGVLDQNQSNYLTTALSYDGLSSALQLLQEFRDMSGEPIGLGKAGLCLIVPPGLYSTAVNLVGGPSIVISESASAQAAPYANVTKMGSLNPYGQGNIQVVSSAFLSDSNDWFLCETSASDKTPVNFWTAGMPTINVTVDEANLKTVITASAFMRAWIDGPSAGIVGSYVA